MAVYGDEISKIVNNAKTKLNGTSDDDAVVEYIGVSQYMQRMNDEKEHNKKHGEITGLKEGDLVLIGSDP